MLKIIPEEQHKTCQRKLPKYLTNNKVCDLALYLIFHIQAITFQNPKLWLVVRVSVKETYGEVALVALLLTLGFLDNIMVELSSFTSRRKFRPFKTFINEKYSKILVRKLIILEALYYLSAEFL